MIVFRKKIKDNGTQKAVQRQRMGILLCEQNFRDVWRRNKSVRAEIGKILRTHKHTHTHAAKLVVRMIQVGILVYSKPNGMSLKTFLLRSVIFMLHYTVVN